MSREILFKAKRKNWRELPKENWWVEGFYSQLPKPSLGATIIANGELCAEDVGDYIIVNKCKQQSNFSNSFPLPVIESEYFEIDPETLCQYTGLTDKNGRKIWENDIVEIPKEEGYFKCEWEEDTARFVLNGDGLTVDFDNYWSYQVEVVGNLFDNPELLEVE